MCQLFYLNVSYWGIALRTLLPEDTRFYEYCAYLIQQFGHRDPNPVKKYSTVHKCFLFQ